MCLQTRRLVPRFSRAQQLRAVTGSCPPQPASMSVKLWGKKEKHNRLRNMVCYLCNVAELVNVFFAQFLFELSKLIQSANQIIWLFFCL